ncbi:hypothetical protein GCM10009868_03780 [Terrabacter aerolatus]|uniref:Phosphatidic acid phosphatase type 2/haloperoxidase domain-containing protein n=1 Tax=Terrabacter aerolatus TaxID=422442 RepID=A0A512CZF6_9MICO|nr:phosphatase PAP2 family protein [Terrabacter aerolatus]GEO29599.1 hypothetical protein TAE01_14090 [Terrabacter aerolatus]
MRTTVHEGTEPGTGPLTTGLGRARRTRRLAAALAGLVALVAALAVGVMVTKLGAARTGELGLDVSISHHRDAALTDLALAVNLLLGTLVAPVLLVVVCATIWVRSRFVATTVAMLTAVGWFSVEVGKLLVQRTRPPATAVHALVSETAADSYPSGHTAFAAGALFAVVAALALAGRSTRAAWMIGVPVVAVVALSRLYLGVHYLSDVIASVVFAGASILVAVAVVQPWLMRLQHADLHRRAASVAAPAREEDSEGEA